MRPRQIALALFPLPLLLTGLALSQEPRPKPEPTPKPVVGERAPGFRLNDHTGHAVDLPLADDEHWTVVAFFPKAATPGCTREVCSLRDAAAELEALGVQVFGASLDDVQALAAFVDAQELNYGLLSDPDGSAARKCGVLPADGRYAQRVTLVIDEKGVLRHVDDGVQVSSHGTDIAKLVRELQG